MGEGTVFSLFVSPHLDRGGGYSIPGVNRGVCPSKIMIGEIPHPTSRWWVPYPADGGEGTTFQVLIGGYPILMMGGYPHLRSGLAVPPTKTEWGTPIQDWMGYCPPPPHQETDQRRAVCLLRSRWMSFL